MVGLGISPLNFWVLMHSPKDCLFTTRPTNEIIELEYCRKPERATTLCALGVPRPSSRTLFFEATTIGALGIKDNKWNGEGRHFCQASPQPI